MRLDQYLHTNKFFSSREKAKQAVEKGDILVNNKIVLKAAKKVSNKDHIEINSDEERFVSRSGEKLATALERYSFSPKNMICLDIGSSTGGFTQCILNRGAAEVYAVDVGTDQMHPSLKSHPKLHLFENTDFRIFDEKIPQLDLVVIDVSFISLRKILPNLRNYLQPNTIIFALFKPQFEVGKVHLKKGICRHPNLKEVIDEFLDFAKEYGISSNEKPYKVPLKGKEGNQEYILKLFLREKQSQLLDKSGQML